MGHPFCAVTSFQRSYGILKRIGFGKIKECRSHNQPLGLFASGFIYSLILIRFIFVVDLKHSLMAEGDMKMQQLLWAETRVFVEELEKKGVPISVKALEEFKVLTVTYTVTKF
jgi:hypothetical protein